MDTHTHRHSQIHLFHLQFYSCWWFIKPTHHRGLDRLIERNKEDRQLISEELCLLIVEHKCFNLAMMHTLFSLFSSPVLPWFSALHNSIISTIEFMVVILFNIITHQKNTNWKTERERNYHCLGVWQLPHFLLSVGERRLYMEAAPSPAREANFDTLLMEALRWCDVRPHQGNGERWRIGLSWFWTALLKPVTPQRAFHGMLYRTI